MAVEENDAVRHLSAFLCLANATARAAPVLPSITERAVWLTALALADEKRQVSVKAWAASTGIGISTLERFANAFGQFGLMETECFGSGQVRLTPSVVGKLRAELQSGID